jgi:hypothetical protein
MSLQKEAAVHVSTKPAFTEVWYEGYVEYDEKKFQFWLIDPQGEDQFGNEYEMEVRWFFKNIPKEVRAIHNQILEQYKHIKNDTRTDKDRSSI